MHCPRVRRGKSVFKNTRARRPSMSNSHFNWDKLVFVLQQQDCILVTGSAISTGKAEDNTERPLTEMLASNFKSNIDDAFLRRFQSIIHFPKSRLQTEHLLQMIRLLNKPQIFVYHIYFQSKQININSRQTSLI